MRAFTRAARLLIGAGGGALTCANAAQAQESISGYPGRPVRVIIPYTPGELVARRGRASSPMV